jgi:mRNA interferase MazF
MFTRSQLQTVIAVVVTSNLALADAPGNVRIAAEESGLPRDSVANVSQVITIDKGILIEGQRRLTSDTMRAIDGGLRLVLGL